MRGKLLFRASLTAPFRNIPAHAGKTIFRSSLQDFSREHPRACGENYRATGKSASTAGTSPRMRGKLDFPGDPIIWLGNIPAHAGKTPARCRLIAHAAEHPRACGENWPSISPSGRLHGTSPRMRGKLGGLPHPAEPQRNIPAHAGKTMNTSRSPMCSPEHPRACGENNNHRCGSVY